MRPPIVPVERPSFACTACNGGGYVERTATGWKPHVDDGNWCQTFSTARLCGGCRGSGRRVMRWQVGLAIDWTAIMRPMIEDAAEFRRHYEGRWDSLQGDMEAHEQAFIDHAFKDSEARGEVRETANRRLLGFDIRPAAEQSFMGDPTFRNPHLLNWEPSDD